MRDDGPPTFPPFFFFFFSGFGCQVRGGLPLTERGISGTDVFAFLFWMGDGLPPFFLFSKETGKQPLLSVVDMKQAVGETPSLGG